MQKATLSTIDSRAVSLPWKIPFIAGTFLGLILLVSSRVAYYKIFVLRPNIAPEMAFVFVPILWIVILALSLPLELVFRRIHLSPHTKLESFIGGAVCAFWLTWWAFPSHAYFFALLNPVVLRVVLRWVCRAITDPGGS